MANPFDFRSKPALAALVALLLACAVPPAQAQLPGLNSGADMTPGAERRLGNQIARDLFRDPLAPIELNPFDAVVFDPPRAGAEAQAKELARSKVKTVVAVSCEPKTFARDAAILIAGGYRLERVTPVDQFAYSTHVEVVGVFRR